RPEGEELRAAIDAGPVPREITVALACVGAIPYASDLRTIDLLGLTDATVAALPIVATRRVLAHEQRDTAAYQRSAGADLPCPRAAHLFYRTDDTELLPWVVRSIGRGARPFAARIDARHWLAGTLPQGAPATRARFPRVDFVDLAEPSSLASFVDESAD